jgi:adenylate cyclase
MRTENLAIVFVDIAGYTPRTSSQTRQENVLMLRRFDGVVRPLVRAYNGRVVKTIGDAFLLTFRSPTDALLCSMAVHDRLVESDARVPLADRFTIRCAVNVGEVRIEDGDVFGEAVNIAARIEGKAGAGEIYFSESVFLSMTRSEVPSEEVGYAELKGISEKVRLYRVPRADEANSYTRKQRDSSGAKPAPDSPHPLPPIALPFAGMGLDRVRGKLETAPAMVQAQGLLRQGGEMATWWRTELRRSKTVQYVTAAVVIALIIVLVWAVKHKPKPATPWEKIQRSLGVQ